MSKTIEVSNLEEAKKQLKKYKGIQFPKTMDLCNAEGYLVGYVTSEANHKIMEFTHHMNVQICNPRQFEINKRSKMIPGEVVVLHDPTKKPAGGWKFLSKGGVEKLEK